MNIFALTDDERRQLVKKMHAHKDETDEELEEYIASLRASEQRALYLHYVENPPRKREREIRRE